MSQKAGTKAEVTQQLFVTVVATVAGKFLLLRFQRFIHHPLDGGLIYVASSRMRHNTTSKKAKKPERYGYTVPTPFELRFFRQFLKLLIYLLLVGKLDTSTDLFHPDGLVVLDHYPDFAIVQRSDHFNQLLLRFGQHHILFRLHFLPPNKKAAAVTNTAAAVFLRDITNPFAHRAGAKK
jgi:hypothetical protein